MEKPNAISEQTRLTCETNLYFATRNLAKLLESETCDDLLRELWVDQHYKTIVYCCDVLNISLPDVCRCL